MKVETRLADYNNAEDAKNIIEQLDEYARDPMGGGIALSKDVKENLIPNLAKREDALSFIIFVNGKAAGMANCFEGFSTFKSQPLLNIHDFAISKKYRGMGLALQLMAEIESFAVKKNYCKLTLEVLEGNKVAQNAYIKYGFKGYQLEPELGQALFWEKTVHHE